MGLLDELAHKYNTDKKTGHHAYTAHYERWFESKRKDVRKILEIGVATGASLRMWEDYFPSATIYGVDNNPECVQLSSDRTTALFASQENPEDMLVVLRRTGVDFDLIIDDGGHHMDEQIASFKGLFPSLRDGGLYVVEDLHTSYWGSYGGGPPGAPGTMVAFLRDLVDDVNKNGISPFADHARALEDALGNRFQVSDYGRQIESIQFFPGIAFIERRSK
jgi:hypothetical protein